VAAITERLCSSDISSTQVSQAAAFHDDVLDDWRNQPLDMIIYLYLDAIYEIMRLDGQIRDAAVLIASGVNPKGRHLILGVSVSLDEHEVHWRDFQHSLVERALKGVKFIISDAREGMQAARKAIFSGIPWQRCQPVLDGLSRVPPPAECQPVCASPEHETGSGSSFVPAVFRDYTHYLQCTRSRPGRHLVCQVPVKSTGQAC
jgi:hypothetical protein